MIGEDLVRSLLRYDRETGLFHWIQGRTRGVKASDIAGTKDRDGYVIIFIRGKRYPAHRLAWFFETGEWRSLDHRDCDRANNRFANLRPASHAENCRNRRNYNGTHAKGIYYRKKEQRWSAQIQKDGQIYRLGCFATESEAHAAYCKAALAIHGEFARLS